MKTRYILLGLVALATTVLASIVMPYDTSKPPSLTIPAGYELAVSALGTATNQFHCISASIYTDAVVSPQGGWLFTFRSTNAPPKSKFVTVEFGGKVHVEDTLFRDE